MSERFLVFDMDGVLVDVAESYRATVIQTVKDFTGREITHELIQDFKNQGGWNDDWELSHRIVSDFGVKVEFDDIVRHFNELFLGNGNDGMILRERWLAGPGLFERLAGKFRLGIFTGRRVFEVKPTLERFAQVIPFDPIVTAEQVARLKPAPDGLFLIRYMHLESEITYIGDTIDDCRCAKAANVPFIGVAAPGSSKRDELVQLFRSEGAIAVIEDINQLESVL